jgi:ankyrin repeat protein
VKSADLLIDCICAERSLDIVSCLVRELGADVNRARLTDGATPLFIAAHIGNLAFVQCLVTQLGAYVDKAAPDGATPLIIAAQMGHLVVVRYLAKELGADVNQGSNSGCTPLYAAAENGYLEIVPCLVRELDADVNQAENDGATPLFIAAQNDHLAVVRLLVAELGADVDQGMPDGTAPLHIAAKKGHLAIVRCLVKELGADVNCKALSDRVTPLMIAAAFEHEGMVTFLIKYGANVQIVVPGYGTAADFSKSVGAVTEQTRYLVARTHCANPGCDGAGVKKCAGCLTIYYCKRECQLAHWPAHKAECRRSADVTAGKREIEPCI